MTEPTHIKDLRADPENRRKHNARNIGMVVDALQKVGAARSIVIDESDTVLAGNGVVEGAAEAGITRVRVVDADGSEIIAVRRRGLTDEQKRALAIYDNRAAELAEWDPEQLRADDEAGLDLASFWTTAELERVLMDPEGPDSVEGVGGSAPKALQLEPGREYVVVMCASGEAGAAEFAALRAKLGLGLVRRGGYRRGSAFDAVGIQRVIQAADLLEKLP